MQNESKIVKYISQNLSMEDGVLQYPNDKTQTDTVYHLVNIQRLVRGFITRRRMQAYLSLGHYKNYITAQKMCWNGNEYLVNAETTEEGIRIEAKLRRRKQHILNLSRSEIEMSNCTLKESIESDIFPKLAMQEVNGAMRLVMSSGTPKHETITVTSATKPQQSYALEARDLVTGTSAAQKNYGYETRETFEAAMESFRITQAKL